jgi:hypothetical protein
VRPEPEWRPSKDNFSLPHFLDRPILRPLILTLERDFVAEGILLNNALNFKCSSDFMSRFPNRANRSTRKARVARPTENDDDECAEFMGKKAAACERRPNDQRNKFDESS